LKTELKIMLPAVLSGLLLTGAFPKINLDGLAWVALVPLLWSLNGAGPGEAFRRGFAFGLAHYLSLLYWLVPTMVIYGHLPAVLAVGILFLFAAILSALSVAPMAWAFGLSAATPLKALFLFAPMWVGAEYLRSFLFTGFPWELFGYSQHRRLHLIQISDIFGVYGVSGLLAFANIAVFLLALKGFRRPWYGRPVAARTAFIGLAAAVLLCALTVAYSDFRLAETDRLAQAAPTGKVAAIQGNIAQSQKWDPAFQKATIEQYLRLSLSTREHKPDLIVWPESAAPFYFTAEVPPTRRVLEGVARTGAYFLIGAPSVNSAAGNVQYYNSAYLVGPSGEVLGRYDKAHLVPFGEYTPYKEYLPFLGKIVEHVGDFVPGREGQTLDWMGHPLGVQICYEIIFPSLSRAMVANGAKLLVTITNDAWYGKTAGPYQHFSLAVLRAVENRRALVRAANTGISGFIDPAGRVLDPTPLEEEAVAVRSLPLMDVRTIYNRIGDAFGAGCLGAALLAVIATWRQNRQEKKRKPF
jgi:apolipoprotein N-acyltransferase